MDAPTTPIVQLYTVPEVATMLDMTEGCVRVMVTRNRLKPTVWQGDGFSRRHLFDWAAVETYRQTYSRFAPRICQHCHKPLPTGRYDAGYRKFCDRQCYNQASRRRDHGLPDDYVAPEGGRYLRLPANCEQCGKEFLAGSSAHRFCSATCRLYAFYERHGFLASNYARGKERVGRAS